MSYELYRKTSLGNALTDALDDMTRHQHSLPPQLALKIMSQFDKSMNEALSGKVKNKANFKGHLHTYRFCDNVWTFILENANFRVGTDNETVQADKVKIVACDGRINNPQ